MVEGNIKLVYADWSPLLRRVVLDDTRWPSRDAVQDLTDHDVEILRKLADTQPAREIRQDKVITALAERAPDAETAKMLDRVIGDAERPASLRTVAAIGLGRIPAATSEKVLLAHVAERDAQVAQRVLQSLGKVGGPNALKMLQAMEPPENAYVRRQWEFSKQLMRHRLGKLNDKPPRIRGTTWDADGVMKSRSLLVESVAPERLKLSIEQLRDQLFGIELAGDRGYGVEFDRSLQYLLMVQALATPEGIERLGKVPMVAAVIAMWEPRTRKAVLDQIVLTDPLEDGVLIQGFRQDGTLLFEGHATVRGTAANFTIVNTDAAQCRFRVTGELKPEGLMVRVENMPRRKARRSHPCPGSLPRPISSVQP